MFVISIHSFPHDIINFQPIEHFSKKPNPQSFEELLKHANDLFTQNQYDEAVAYYKQALAFKPTIPQVFFNMGQALFWAKKYNEALYAYQQAAVYKPNYIRAYIQAGKVLTSLGKPDEAIEQFEKARDIDPNTTETYLLIARIYNEKHKFTHGIEELKKGLSIEPENTNLLFELANTYNTINKLEESIRLYKQLLERMPDNATILYNIAFTLKKLGRVHEALPYYDKTLEVKPDHTEAHFSRGLAYLLIGDFEKGWQGYEWRYNRPQQGSKRTYPQPRWDGSDLIDKTIYLHSEQGLGDTFQFIRYAKIAKQKNGHVIAGVQKPLVRILSLCPYIDNVREVNEAPPSFDVHAPIMSLPYLLKTRINSIPSKIPYLYADEKLTQQWKEKLSADKNFKIGICWQGNSHYSTPMLRAAVAKKSIHVSQLTPLCEIPGVSVYSLQKITGTDQLNKLPEKMNIITFDNDFDQSNGRFMDTAAVIKNLDLVITIDTSICHLAGGLGIPVWVMLPNPPDWRWMLERNDTPWYPTMKLFRQPTPDDWNSVISTIVDALKKLIHTKKTDENVVQKNISTSHSLYSQLSHEKNEIEKGIRELSHEIKKHADNPYDETFVKNVRQFYLLNQLYESIREKIQILSK